MPASVVGRDVELALISDFLTGIPDGASVLVLEGEAGMGKTTLFDACVTDARESGALVLVARPAESETELSFAGLGDLLAGTFADVLDSLPPAQQRALSRALVLDDEEDAPSDPRSIGVAVQSALTTLGASRVTLVAIDDVQWLDEASAGALSFACRRLEDARVGVLLARRSGLSSSLVADLVRSLAGGVQRVDVGPLDVAALHLLVQDRLGATLPRPLLAEVCQASGGNPFFAIEIVRTLQRRGASVEAGQPLPVPDSLHDLLDERIRALTPESRDFLLAAAAHAHPTIAITEEAMEVDAETGLRPALDAGIVELDGSRIRFTHPLLAACAYETADPLRRRFVHERLSQILEDPEARAWQLAAATDDADEEVAAILEDAARHARARGAPRPAALLLDRAHELTPADRPDDAVRRAVDAAYLHYESGDSVRAEDQLRAVVDRLSPGPVRARALVRLARVRMYEALGEGADLFQQAVAEATDDPELLAVAHEGFATCLWQLYERLETAVEHAGRAVELALAGGDEALAGEALNTSAMAEILLGRESACETIARAVALQPAAEHRRVLSQPRWFPEYGVWTGALDEAQVELEAMLERAAELGDESSPPYLVACLARVDSDRGRFSRALENATAAQEAAKQSGQRAILAFGLALESLVRARMGGSEACRAAAAQALDLARETGDRQSELTALWALGHLELAEGDSAAAAARLSLLFGFVRSESIEEPGATLFVVDYIEALGELGSDEAQPALDWFEGNARRLGRTVALANCARCRGILAARSGDMEGALAAFEEALAFHDQVDAPLDRGRTLLALGATLRRMKRRREGRVTLEDAVRVFEGIGAALWAERATAELKRISGRAASPGELTPAEQRVAALVVEGKTNKEVAAALFVSDRTVEGHLARIFGKLGIRHRAELSGALQTRGIDVSNTGDSPVSAEPAAP
jgi:DNA-binding CsgD family transcriptional regulator